jgi:hypothetical protein
MEKRKIKKAKHITARDIAKKLGVEKDYDVLIEQEIEKTRKNFLDSDFVELKK